MLDRLGVFVAKLRGLFVRQRMGREFQDEIENHIQMLTERFIRQGVPHMDAAAAARRQFGNSALLRERHWEQGSFTIFATLWRDLGFGARQLRRNPIFSLVAITSLALGIGANTAIFTAAKRVLLDTLPVKEPGQLRMLEWVSGHEQPVPPVWGDVSTNEAGGLTGNGFSYPVFEAMRGRSDAAQDFIAFKDVPLAATIDGQPEMVDGELISGNAFQSLGVQAKLGRALTLNDDTGVGKGPVVVITDGYWAQRFARAATVIGKEISLNGTPVTIVGVCRGPFAGLQMAHAAQVFVPLTMQPLVVPRAQNGSVSLLNNPQSWWVQVLVRLRRDVSEARAEAMLDGTLRHAAIPVLSRTADIDRFHLKMESGGRGLDDLRGEYARPSYVLLGLAGLILLLGCVNLANLLLAQSASRRREMSTRVALGASRCRIVRQILTESILLSGGGGLAGLALGYLARTAIPRLLEGASRPDLAQVDFDWRVLLFTLGISLATGVLFGLAPAWQATRSGAYAGLRDAGSVSAGRQRLRLDKVLVIGQIALSAILLVSAGLFVHTLINLNRVPLGFATNNILLFQLNPPRARYSQAGMMTLYQRLEQSLAAIPGVRSVTMSTIAIIGDGHSGSTFHVSGRAQEKDAPRVQTNGVGVDFFETLGIPILQGRAFNIHDTATSPKVAVINRALALKYFPGENPVGQRFEADAEDVEGPIQIVGIAADTRYADLRSETPPTFYVPYQQKLWSSRMVVELRTAVNPGGVLAAARQALGSLDKDLPLVDVRSMQEQIRSTLREERALAKLAGGFSALALVMATIGIYGIMAYTVNARTGEIGLRIALGAPPTQVLSRFLWEAFGLTVAGMVLGSGTAIWLTRFVRSILFGLGTADPVTLGGTAGLLMVVSILAAFIPARRASRIDPIRALRHD